MNHSKQMSVRIPFTSSSSLEDGFHVSAAPGGGAPHAFLVDTGSVGMLVPRSVLGPDYQDFDPGQDERFEYISSGKTYMGQWVEVPVILGVPADWDGTGDYPTAQIEVFAADQPADFDGGILGVGFGIGKVADGGPGRNPLLHVRYQGADVGKGYIISTGGIDVGLTSANTEGFLFVDLEHEASGPDWIQPVGSVGLTGSSVDEFSASLPFLMDTGIPEMIIWTSADDAPALPIGSPFPDGIAISIAVPQDEETAEAALAYSFLIGDASQLMAPTYAEWRVGNGINTGRYVLAGADYLYDSVTGRIGFRVAAGLE